MVGGEWYFGQGGGGKESGIGGIIPDRDLTSLDNELHTGYKDGAVFGAVLRAYIHEPARAAAEAGLFAQFPDSGFRYGLVRLNETAGQGPASYTRFYTALYQKEVPRGVTHKACYYG